MKTLPPPVSDMQRAVSEYKRELLVRVMRAIIAVSFRQPYFCAGDIAEDIVAPEHRQGVVSNAWNSLKALEIIEQLPVRFMDDERGIVAGRMMNRNTDAKGRWVCAYRLRSRGAAETWIDANNAVYRLPASKAPAAVERELQLT